MKAMTPMMMPKKQAMTDRIMKARVASQYAVSDQPETSQHISTLYNILMDTFFCPRCDCLTDAVCVHYAFSRYTVAPQAHMRETAGLAVLHPVIGGSGDHQEYVPYSCTEQSTSHKAVHLAPTNTLTKYESIIKLIHQDDILLKTYF